MDRRVIRVDMSPTQAGITAALRRAFEAAASEPCDRDFAELPGTGTILLRMGCLDTDITERPRVHIWRSDAASWFDPKDQLPEWPEGKAPKN